MNIQFKMDDLFHFFCKKPQLKIPGSPCPQASIFESLGDVMSSAILAVTQPLGAMAMTQNTTKNELRRRKRTPTHFIGNIMEYLYNTGKYRSILVNTGQYW